MISEAMRPTCEESCSEMAIGTASARKNNTVSKVRRGVARDAQRQEAWPELQRQHRHMLVELRHVDPGDKAMTDRHVLGAVWLERRDRVHRETGERAVGEELDVMTKPAAQRAPATKASRRGELGLCRAWG